MPILTFTKMSTIKIERVWGQRQIGRLCCANIQSKEIMLTMKISIQDLTLARILMPMAGIIT